MEETALRPTESSDQSVAARWIVQQLLSKTPNRLEPLTQYMLA
jgi:hypothetical protein